MQEISVYCVNVGDKYGTDYVFKLKAAVEKHLTLNHKFYCITDKTNLYDFSIKAEDLPGYWNKISIFKHKGKCLYFDLDVIIHGNIDSLISGHEFRQINPVWKDPRKAKYITDRPDLGTSYTNSSVMTWTDEVKIYEKFMKDPEYYMFKYDGDDRFLYHETKHNTFDAGKIYSYRDGAHWQNDNKKYYYRKNYSVALFHQQPEIHECLDHDIVKENW